MAAGRASGQNCSCAPAKVLPRQLAGASNPSSKGVNDVKLGRLEAIESLSVPVSCINHNRYMHIVGKAVYVSLRSDMADMVNQLYSTSMLTV